jgi:hypothetical protein
MEDDIDSMRQKISEADWRRFTMSKVEKLRFRVSNIYAHNAFMMLDKEREAERLAKVYKKKQIKNVKNREFQLSAKGIKNERGHQWLSFKNIHASGWQDVFI